MPEVTLGLAGPFSHGRVISEISSVTSPAAGAGFSITVSPKYWERGLSLAFQLVTDATDISRFPILTVKDQEGVIVWATSPPGGPGQSATGQFTFAPDTAAAGLSANGYFIGLFPEFFLIPTWTVNITVANIASGDQISNIRWYRERFITGHGGYEIGTTFYESDDQHRFQVRADELA